MRAAMEIVAQDGLPAATTAAIAGRAGVAEGTLYRHFSGKDELLIAAYRHVKAAAAEAVLSGHDQTAPIDERIRQLWRGIFDVYRTQPTAFRFGQRFSESALAAQEGGVAHETLNAALSAWRRDALAEGRIKPLPDDLLIALVTAPILALLKREIAGRVWSEEDLDLAVNAVWDALKR